MADGGQKHKHLRSSSEAPADSFFTLGAMLTVVCGCCGDLLFRQFCSVLSLLHEFFILYGLILIKLSFPFPTGKVD